MNINKTAADITGFSMGGRESLFMKFAENQPYIMMISSADNDGVVGSFPDSYRNILDSNYTEYFSHTMSQTGHDPISVTPHLYNFFRVIFHEN